MGFDEWCNKCYGIAVCHKGVPISFDEECELKDEGIGDEIEYVEGTYLYDFGCDNRKEDAKVYAAPTLWVTLKWLREVHNIDISVTPDRKTGYSVLIFKDKRLPFDTLDSYSTYERACEAAIKYCLEDLI